MNDERLKNPKPFGEDYFDELLERIREIRASEKRFYQKICDIYKTSVDDSSNDKDAELFFKTVQNKYITECMGIPQQKSLCRGQTPRKTIWG